MKGFLQHIQLFSLIILQGLQKILIIVCGIISAIDIWKIGSLYIKSKQMPDFKQTAVLLICIIGIIVLMLLNNIIETKLSELQYSKILRKQKKL